MIRRSAIAGDRLAVLQRSALQDGRLSWRARGLLAGVLSRPIDWRTSADQLAHEVAGAERGEGRDAIRIALKELEKLGYLRRSRTQDEKGHWTTAWDLSDEPVTCSEPVKPQVAPKTESQASVNQPSAGQPSVNRTSVGQASYRSRESDLETPPNPPAPEPPSQHSPAEPGEEMTWPTHVNERNALQSLDRVRADHRLPIPAAKLLGHAYRIGCGDPWAGYLAMKPVLEQTLEGARDPAAVLTARLGKTVVLPPSTSREEHRKLVEEMDEAARTAAPADVALLRSAVRKGSP